jgi:hypothetical protein
MKAYITKYALTVGIQEVEVELSPDHPHYISWKEEGVWGSLYAYGKGKQWHRTKDAALAKAEQMRLAKIESHKKSIKKLESLKWPNVKS